MTDDELLALAREVIGEAFFGRADYVPKHKDIFIQQTYDGCVNMLTLHLRPLIKRHRAEVETAKAEALANWNKVEELKAEVERLTRERDAWELTSRTSSATAKVYEDVARGKSLDQSIVLDAVNRLNEVRNYAPPCVTRHEMEQALELIRDAMIANMSRAEAAESALAAAQKRVGELQGTVAFFASVIKSGEPWTQTCEDALRAALKASGNGDETVRPDQQGEKR